MPLEVGGNIGLVRKNKIEKWKQRLESRGDTNIVDLKTDEGATD